MAIDAVIGSAYDAVYTSPIEQVELMRLRVMAGTDPQRKKKFSQYFTPMPIARFMASMFTPIAQEHVIILDPSAGIGSLLIAAVDAVCMHPQPPISLHVYAVEIDSGLASYLQRSIDLCRTIAESVGIQFASTIIQADFIETALQSLEPTLFASSALPRVDYAILNPPYRKIASTSYERKLLQQLGLETSNIYTGFLYATMRLLKENGQMVALTPRSFCNGPYFRSFRKAFLREIALRRLHVFTARDEVFDNDEVLQEHLITAGIKTSARLERIQISTSGADLDSVSVFDSPYSIVVHPDDAEQFIHIITGDQDNTMKTLLASLPATLEEMGIQVSTGRVVDFRAKAYLRKVPEYNTVPLVYPEHLQQNNVEWPKRMSKKSNALLATADTEKLFVPNEDYVLVKRFSAKEEPRRIMATCYQSGTLPGKALALENHLNYYHCNGKGLNPVLAKGLTLFLNSTWVDQYFRQFSGHTQVNATDLRAMRYPSREQLVNLGEYAQNGTPLSQREIDDLVAKELFGMTDEEQAQALQRRTRVQEALSILKSLGLPRAQQNDRSAMVLLALLDLQPSMAWSQASAPLLRTVAIMDFIKANYGVAYAPNTRETIRRQSLHQFLAAGIVVENPDNPERPTNSPDYVYQIERSTLELLQTFGSNDWQQNLETYLESIETLKERYARERAMKQIPVQIAPGKTLMLSSGGQNILIEKIIHDFAPRFTPGAKLLYVGDTADKFAYFDEQAFQALGVQIESHGKMPDVVIYHEKKQQLVLIEAVTSHGPIDAQRKAALQNIFRASLVEPVFVTAFLGRKELARFVANIAWETDVWIAESPTHLIHFNGMHLTKSPD